MKKKEELYDKKNEKLNKLKKNIRKKGKRPYNNKDKSDDNIKIEQDNSDVLSNRSRFGNPNWYFVDKTLAEQTAQFSFQDFIGSGTLINNGVTLPSIMTISLNPSADNSLAGYAGISTATLMARKLYNSLANTSGRTQNYAPQDVFTLLLALGEIISYASYLKRALGVAYTYNIRNRDFPSKIIDVMGINSTDLFANLNKYRVELNTLLTQVNKIPFPANIAWFDKCNALYEGIFQDNMSPMSQIYILKPATTWILDESSYEQGTVLRTIPVSTNSFNNYAPSTRNMSAHISSLRDMIQALLTSTTLNYIYGDILNYASKFNVKLLYMNMIEDSYTVMPQYDQEVLLHIHNMLLLGAPTVDISEKREPSTPILATYTPYNDVFPDVNNNSIIYNPVFKVTNTANELIGMAPGLMDIVDFPFGVPDLVGKIEATRFQIRNDIGVGEGEKSLAYINDNDIAGIVATVLPDHYPVRISMYAPDGTTSIVDTSFKTSISINLSHFLSKFDNAPLIYYTNTETGISYVFGDVNYYTNLPGDILSRMCNITYQSLFELR
jgi:hypothetical protein